MSNQLDTLTKLTLALIPPVGGWFLRSALTRKPPGEILSFLVAAYSQSVGLYGLKNMYDEIKKNLGRKMTQTRSFQVFSFAGSAVYTASLWGIIGTTVGKTFFGFNVIYTLAYGYFLYLTYVYNRDVPDPTPTGDGGAKRGKGRVHWPSFAGYAAAMAAMLTVWTRETRSAVGSGSGNFLAIAGFLMSAFASLRAGLRTVLTSVPAITPFSGVAPLASAISLGILSLVPLARDQPVARIYLSGYLTMIYCLVVMAAFSLKEERKAYLAAQEAKTQGGAGAKPNL